MLTHFLTFWQQWLGKQSKKNSLIDTPTEKDLKRWAYSEWVEYQAWLFHYGFLTLQDWQQLRHDAQSWLNRPFLSVVTPVFNTHPTYLRECVYSVQTQAYPHWEMCLVDDGSDNPETLACLQQLEVTDSRLRILRLPHNQGICHATNQAIAMAQGDYVVFLDHDDRLAPEALYWVAKTIINLPQTDIIYSDRDTLSPNGYRFLHLFKPDWSPETLLSGNYLFHLMVYRRTLLKQLSGVRIGLEGSQDYDLILRAAELQPQVQHLRKVLYHWRQHGQSIALAQNAKEYIYDAGIRALQEALERRNLPAQVSENKALWRGHYRVQLRPPPLKNYRTLRLTTEPNYAQQVNQALALDNQFDFLVVFGPTLEAKDMEALPELVSWLQIPEVGMVTGQVLDEQGNLLHAGLVQRPNGIPLAVYAGFPDHTPGYMAVTAIVRNLSTPHPACVAIKRSLWQDLGGLDTSYESPYALLDFALRTLHSGKRIVYTPFARFIAHDWPLPETWSALDQQRFLNQWATWLQQDDPYYSPYLTLELADMGLNLDWSKSE